MSQCKHIQGEIQKRCDGWCKSVASLETYCTLYRVTIHLPDQEASPPFIYDAWRIADLRHYQQRVVKDLGPSNRIKQRVVKDLGLSNSIKQRVVKDLGLSYTSAGDRTVDH